MATEVLSPTVTFDQERLTPQFQAELMPLLVLHWAEIAHWKDIPLEPDWEAYYAVLASGALRAFTFRETGLLKGYGVFVVKESIHYRSSKQASQDIIWVAPEYRKQMLGARFIQWCDEQLALEGVEVVHHHVKLAHDFGKTLERLGYEAVETIYSKRLTRG